MRTATVKLPVSPFERMWLDNLKIASGLADDADVLRLAVWHLSKHYDADLPGSLFVLQQGTPKRGRR